MSFSRKPLDRLTFGRLTFGLHNLRSSQLRGATTLSIMGFFATLNITVLSAFLLSVITSITGLSAILLSVIILNAIMLNVVMLSVVILNGIVLNVVMLSVVAPALKPTFGRQVYSYGYVCVSAKCLSSK